MTSQPEHARKLFAVALTFAASLSTPALAQCPDGSPPPCGRRAVPAIDARTWIVVPFNNVTREPDVDWLRDASVNLLYLGMSRWRDLRVIDDGRVADLVRALPGGERTTLSLEAGLELARRAGAGRLVMGDLLKSGPRVSVVAKVYDSGNGRRLRTVTEEIVGRESTMPSYSRLAARIVDAPMPTDASSQVVGTSSLDAYKAYAEGLRALHSWQLDSATRRFERAIRVDPTFALARYRLSMTLGWTGLDSLSQLEREHAEAAARFSAGLPPRERALISSRQQAMSGNAAGACETIRGLLAADSLDVEAWYQLGECNYHNNSLEGSQADTANTRFAGDWTVAYQAFKRALELDPSMHLSYEHLLEMLRFVWRRSCLTADCSRALYAMVEVRNDSLFTEPRFASVQRPLILPLRAPRLNAAATLARQWIASAPHEASAHYQYGLVLKDQRRFSQAATAFATARRLGGLRPRHAFEAPYDHVRMLLAADSAPTRTIPQAVALGDSLLRRLIRAPAPDAITASMRHEALAATLGRFSLIPRDASDGIAWRQPPGLHRGRALLAAGVVPPELDSLVARSAAADVPAAIRAAMQGWFAFICHRLCTVSYIDTVRTSPLGRLADGDTASARQLLRMRDSVLANTEPESMRLQYPLGTALANVAIGDTAAALRALKHFERVRYAEGFDFGLPAAVPGPWLLGRAWLLHADLLRATGAHGEANLYYQRVADLWSGGDPEVQPFVARAREAMR